eukprot:gene21635-24534_t
MSTKKRKGLSAEEKRNVILGIYHDRKEPFNLKEIETIASKMGVVQQTVKDMNQSLVDDFLVFSDKIGSANFFWSFPSKAYQDQNVRKDNLVSARGQIQQNIESAKEQIVQARADRSHPSRNRMMAELANLKKEEEHLDGQLEQLKVNDPEEIRRVEKLALINKAAADRWTDNIWQIKTYLTKKKGMAGKEADKLLHIDSSFDYVEYQPVGSKRKVG